MLDVIKNRYIYVGSSFLVVFFSLIMILFWVKNYWIDMTWWTQSEYSYTWKIDISILWTKLENIKTDFNEKNQHIINGLSIYQVSGEEKIVIETWFNSLNDEKQLEAYKWDFNKQVLTVLHSENQSFFLYKYTNIWKTFWDYIKKTAFITLAISLVWIAIYIGFAFFGVAVGVPAMSFAAVALLTQFHDVVVATWLYIFSWFFFPELKIDTFFITALLTILGYSINDTIVVFDRIRENIKKYVKNKQLDEIVNISINETLQRSIYTSVTLLLVLISIFFFGSEVLKWFMLAMIYWVVFGTYSSIFVAAPLLYELNKNKELKIYTQKTVKPEDKIVV